MGKNVVADSRDLPVLLMLSCHECREKQQQNQIINGNSGNMLFKKLFQMNSKSFIS